MLSEQENVLIVDCDPQANVTGFFMVGSPADPAVFTRTLAEEDNDMDIPDTPGFIQMDVQGFTLGSGEAAPARLPKRGRPQPRTKTEIRADLERGAAVTCQETTSLHPTGDVFGEFEPKHASLYELLAPAFLRKNTAGSFWRADGAKDDGTPLPFEPIPLGPEGRKDALRLLPGTSDLMDIEFALAGDWKSTAKNAVMRLCTFRSLLVRLAKRLDVAYVIVDLSPSASAFNKMAVLSSDLLFPPVFPDRFSVSSSSILLSKILPEWWQSHAALHKASAGFGDGDVMPFKSNPPLIAPFLFSNYRFKLSKVEPPSDRWIRLLRDHLNKYDAASTVAKSMLLPRDKMAIAFVRLCHRFHVTSNWHRKPLVWITRKETGISDAKLYQAEQAYFRSRYAAIIQLIKDAEELLSLRP